VGCKPQKVAAIVMTMVGSKSQVKATPDEASRMYIERAIAIAEKYPNVFGHDDPSDSFVLTEFPFRRSYQRREAHSNFGIEGWQLPSC
jgi:hypothetical protein